MVRSRLESLHALPGTVHRFERWENSMPKYPGYMVNHIQAYVACKQELPVQVGFSKLCSTELQSQTVLCTAQKMAVPSVREPLRAVTSLCNALAFVTVANQLVT